MWSWIGVILIVGFLSGMSFLIGSNDASIMFVGALIGFPVGFCVAYKWD